MAAINIVVNFLTLSLAAVGVCPIFILPVTDFIAFAEHISKVAPSLRAQALVDVIPGSALPFGFLPNKHRQNVVLKSLDCFITGNYCV